MGLQLLGLQVRSPHLWLVRSAGQPMPSMYVNIPLATRFALVTLAANDFVTTIPY